MKNNVRVLAFFAVIALLLTAFAIPVLAAEETSGGTVWYLRPSFIIPIALFLAAIIACVIIFFVLPSRREKTLKFFRSLKSECKKVSWYTWKQTWKGTLVVLVTVVALAAAIGLLDLAFSKGISAIDNLLS